MTIKEDLPKLTSKENAFVFHLYTDCLNNPTKAYKLAYDCKNSKENTIYVEVSRLLKNPKITLWREFYEKNIQDYQEQEIKYSRKDFIDELERIRAKTEDTKNVGIALKAVELKGKSFGFLKDNVELSGAAVVQMGEVKINGDALSFNVGNYESDASENAEYTTQNAPDDNEV